MYWHCSDFFFTLAALNVCHMYIIWISNLNSHYVAWSKSACVNKSLHRQCMKMLYEKKDAMATPLAVVIMAQVTDATAQVSRML